MIGEVREVQLKDIKGFIEANHYSRSINGVKCSKAYGLYVDNLLVGAVLYGPLSTTAWKKYAEDESEVVELRRLVCLDTCPRNTESWLISKTIKLLRKSTQYAIAVSYADPRHNHVGYIYQAANWNYVGSDS